MMALRLSNFSGFSKVRAANTLVSQLCIKLLLAANEQKQELKNCKCIAYQS